MSVFDSYIDGLLSKHGKQHADGVRANSLRVARDCISSFDYTGHNSAILLGHVQSGKTGTLIGLLSIAVDHEFKFLVVLTSDNILLYEQTIKRIATSLDSLNVFGEKDDDMFVRDGLRSPCVIVLKKNHSILKNWLKKFAHVTSCKDEPLVLIDDEADAASLNTLVNKSRISTINGLIRDIIKVAPSSLYVQTTATPFGNLLLNELSTTKAKVVTRFSPPPDYMGGEFFYGEDSSSYELFQDDESKQVLSKKPTDRPQGLYKAICYYIGHVIHQVNNGSCKDNFLVHPSHKVADHKYVAERIAIFLDELSGEVVRENPMVLQLIPSMTGASFYSFEEIGHAISEIRVVVVNSETELPDLDTGYHVIVGGNCLGRGLTIPQLNVCYYTRTSKAPQADTLLQHSRIFGYDRDREHAKVFLSKPMLLNFRGISKAVETLHECVEKGTLKELKLLLPKDLSPTRKSVIDKDTYISLSGGVNYFIQSSSESSTPEVDAYTSKYEDTFTTGIAWLDDLLNIIKTNDDLIDKFKYALTLLDGSGATNIDVFIRRNRSISKGTGTLLSPDDRLLSKKKLGNTACFLYRINGEKEKGWGGSPIWLVNLRFPANCMFIGTEDI